MSYTGTFAGSAVAQSGSSFLALTIASNTALVWPLESTAGAPYAASWLNVTATNALLKLEMPPGNTGSNGPVSIISNVGSITFTVTDQAGNQITTVAAGQVWIVVLTSNATTNGTWNATQLGSTVSNATASGLAGAGLTANGSLLQLSWPTTTLTTSGAVTSSADGTVLVYTGAGAATLALGVIGQTINVGTIFAFSNQSSAMANLTFSSPSGALINGITTLVVPIGAGGFLIAGASSWTAITYGSVFPSLSVANGTMTVDTAGNMVTSSLTIATTMNAAAGALTISSGGNLSTSGNVLATSGLGSFGEINSNDALYVAGISTLEGGIYATSFGTAAAAGIVGEVLTVNFSNVTLAATGVISAAATLTLGKGDWDVRGNALFIASGSVNNINIAVNTAAALPGFNSGLSESFLTIASGTSVSGCLVPCQILLTATATTVAFLCQGTYTTGTITGTGFLQARRMR